jgi:hypothetical protein
LQCVLIAFPGQDEAFKAGFDDQVGDDVLAAAALDRHLGGLGANARGGNDNARDLDQSGHAVRLQASQRADVGVRLDDDLDVLHLLFTLGAGSGDLSGHLFGCFLKLLKHFNYFNL